MKNLIISASLLFCSQIIIAQTSIKIGYVSSEKLYELMPDAAKAKILVENKYNSLVRERELKTTTYNNLIQSYKDNQERWSEAVKQSREAEIQKLGEEIQQFTTNGEKTITDYQNQVYSQVKDKASKAIDAVALKYRYSLILDKPQFVYASMECDDVTGLVYKELNIAYNSPVPPKNLVVKNPKFAVVNFADFFESFPEYKVAAQKLQDKSNRLQTEVVNMQNKYNFLVSDYQKNASNWSSSVLKAKESEIVELQEQITSYHQKGSETIKAYQDELYQPIIQKANDIVKLVATENNFTLVFENTNSALIGKSSLIFDLTQECKRKAGIISGSKQNFNSSNSVFVYAYLNVGQALPKLEEYTALQLDLKNYQDRQSKQIEKMQEKFENLYREYLKNKNSMSDQVMKEKEQELSDLQNSLEQFQNQVNEELLKRNQKLYDDIEKIITSKVNKIANAQKIDFVLNENKFLYVDKRFLTIEKYFIQSSEDEQYEQIISDVVSKPIITILEPNVKRGFKQSVQTEEILVKAEVTSVNGISNVLINKQKASFMGNNLFQAKIRLAYGTNTITVEATDVNNNLVSEQFQIDRNDILENNVVSTGNKPDNTKDKISGTGKYYALIIGNNKYNDVSISSLTEPISDATKLYNVLTQKYNFDPNNVTFLKNATFLQTIEAFDDLSNKVTPDDNLLVFYAGHGWWDETKSLGYWLPVDAKKSSTGYWLPNSRISDYMSSIKSKHTLLIADACFSGSIFKTRNAFADAQPAITKLYELPSRKAMTSGNLKEVPDKSFFLQMLVKRLNDNTEKYISSDVLFSSFRIAVLNNSPTEPQYGTIQNAGDEGGEFIFIRK
jgi:Skp family chaperone for outer membrane proteins